ncbi:CWF19-like protein 1 [Orchesella cincta]|uniref:CWF19-like protein 1 n=1 Tax=Orchesella cincta TaxID=48709 RepID=A0A1D2NL81_ORCCI|nr:CWF19-like protein 1 [Orchesella cincta]
MSGSGGTRKAEVSTKSLKILVAGDVDGKFKELFDRVTTVNKKNGPFSMLFCVGSFFPPTFQEELDIPPAPVPTYVLGPVTSQQLAYFPDLNGAEIAPNITYLGRQGVYNESSGLKIAYLSGIQQESGKTKEEHNFNHEDVRNLHIRLENESGFRGVDIFLTTQWPAGVQNHAPPPEEEPSQASTLLSPLTKRLKPRYHFAGIEGIHYERVPFRNHEVLAQAAQHCTRFIALGKVANSKKRKWIYAFNIVPLAHISREELMQEPNNITQNPFVSQTVPQIQLKNENQSGAPVPSNQFFYDASYTGESYRGRGGRGGRGRGGFNKRPYPDEFNTNSRGGAHPPKRQPPVPQGPCWFCLASPEVEKHLIISIGESVYLTIAKGGLTPDHLLIVPIGHFQSTIECPPEVAEEVNKFKTQLIKYFETQGKAVIFFERNFKSPHLQIQVVPIPKPSTVGLKIACLDFAESDGIEIQEFPPNAELFQMTKPGFPYFFMELPDRTKLFVAIKKNFPIQFGRELLASEQILNCPDKVDWKQCKMNKEEEIDCVKQLREGFSPFDFTV